MDDSRFDALTRLVERGRSRREMIRTLMGGAALTVVGLVPLVSEDASAKKKRKKKRCLKSGAACDTDKQCCSKSGLICDVPHGASNSDTECCGGQGSVCGGVNEDGDAQPPFCCVGEAGVRSFECSANDPANPGVRGTCIPVPGEI